MCSQRRLRSAWASAQSDQSSLSAWRKLGSLASHWAHSEDSDQTGRMPRLIWVFAGRTCHFVGVVMRRLRSIWWHRKIWERNLLLWMKGTWSCKKSNNSLFQCQMVEIWQCYFMTFLRDTAKTKCRKHYYVPHRRGGGHIGFGASALALASTWHFLVCTISHEPVGGF